MSTTVKGMRALLAVPVFGDPDQIAAVHVLELIEEMGFTSPDAKVDGGCVECGGTGTCSHCGQDCPECGGTGDFMGAKKIETLTEAQVRELYGKWREQKAQAA